MRKILGREIFPMVCIVHGCYKSMHCPQILAVRVVYSITTMPCVLMVTDCSRWPWFYSLIVQMWLWSVTLHSRGDAIEKSLLHECNITMVLYTCSNCTRYLLSPIGEIRILVSFTKLIPQCQHHEDHCECHGNDEKDHIHTQRTISASVSVFLIEPVVAPVLGVRTGSDALWVIVGVAKEGAEAEGGGCIM